MTTLDHSSRLLYTIERRQFGAVSDALARANVREVNLPSLNAPAIGELADQVGALLAGLALEPVDYHLAYTRSVEILENAHALRRKMHAENWRLAVLMVTMETYGPILYGLSQLTSPREHSCEPMARLLAEAIPEDSRYAFARPYLTHTDTASKPQVVATVAAFLLRTCAPDVFSRTPEVRDHASYVMDGARNVLSKLGTGSQPLVGTADRFAASLRAAAADVQPDTLSPADQLGALVNQCLQRTAGPAQNSEITAAFRPAAEEDPS